MPEPDNRPSLVLYNAEWFRAEFVTFEPLCLAVFSVLVRNISGKVGLWSLVSVLKVFI